MKKYLLLMVVIIFIFSLLVITGCGAEGEEVRFWDWVMSFFVNGS